MEGKIQCQAQRKGILVTKVGFKGRELVQGEMLGSQQLAVRTRLQHGLAMQRRSRVLAP